MKPALAHIRLQAQKLRSETHALYLAARDPRTPWYAKILVAAIVAYAFSPIDLVPDFIPVLGYLDDLVLLPLGITLAVRLIPPAVLEDCRRRARKILRTGKDVSRAAGVVVIGIWLSLGAVCVGWLYRTFLG